MTLFGYSGSNPVTVEARNSCATFSKGPSRVATRDVTLSDVRSPCTAQALLFGLAQLFPGNRALVLDALSCDDERMSSLLDTLADGPLRRHDPGTDRTERLVQHPDEALRRRAAMLLGDEKKNVPASP